MSSGYPQQKSRPGPQTFEGPPVAANDNRKKLWFPSPANDNTPGVGRPLTTRRVSPGLWPQIGPFEAFAVGYAVGLMVFSTKWNPLGSPGWGLIADCGRGPGTFSGNSGLYCGPLADVTPAGVLEDPTSWSLLMYSDYPLDALFPYRFNELWGKAKPYPYNGELSGLESVGSVYAPFGQANVWPWTDTWVTAGQPWPRPFPVGDPLPAPDPGRPTHPKPKPKPDPDPEPDPPVVSVVSPVGLPGPPGPHTKETKIAIAFPAGLALNSVNDATEVADFVRALQKGLPVKDRAFPVWEAGGSQYNWVWDKGWKRRRGKYRHPRLSEMAKKIYDHLDHMDWNEGFSRLMEEAIGDFVHGGIGRIASRANRRRGMPGGVQLGPAI